MQLPDSEDINVGYLSRIFDKRSECYKFFWFKAIMECVEKGQREFAYEELVDIMIANAWYMVTEYHLNLGPADALEEVVLLIKEKNPELKSCEKKDVILKLLQETDDKDINKVKRRLTYNVPYRLQAPFLPMIKGEDWDIPKSRLIDQINSQTHLMYYFSTFAGLNTRIVLEDEWLNYITKNKEIIQGWLEYKMIQYLQRRNPSVPGIADKIEAPQDRSSLDKVKRFWKVVLTIEPVREIYDNQILTEKDLSIDHFVPWSYVAHDEMWNLNPTTKSINSSKSNNLPDWDKYFERLVQQEFRSYQLLWKYESVHDEFNKCAKEHINSDDIRYRVYREGLQFNEFAYGLESVLRPVYQSAQNCGFGRWQYQKETA